MMSPRFAFLATVQCHDPQNMSDPFTYQLRPFTTPRNPRLQHSLLRKTKATGKQICRTTPRVASQPCPICIPHLQPTSPWTSHSCSRPPPEAAPPPTHARCPQPDAAAYVQTALCGSAQVGTALAAQVRAPPPIPVQLCIAKPRRG